MKIDKIIVIALLITILGWLLPMDSKAAYAATKPQNPKVSSDISRWDCVYFGKYPQSDATGQKKEAIKWRVYMVEGDIMWLVSDTKLDLVQFHNKRTNVNFASSTLNTWLNTTFKNAAFNSSEKAAMLKYDGLKEVSLLAPYMTTGAKYGFINNASRAAKMTNYSKTKALKNGAPAEYVNNDSKYGAYWLNTATIANSGGRIEVVRGGGFLNSDFYVDNNLIFVRPAIKLKISSSAWSHAPKVLSNGATKPSKPVNFTAALKGRNGVTLKWKSVPEADGYAVSVYRSGKLVNTKYYNANSFAGSKTITGLRYTTDYSFKVRAYWNVGTKKTYSAYSAKKNVTTRKLAPPTSYVLKKSGMNTAKLTWKSVNGADGYQIYRKLGSNDWKKIATVKSGNRTYYTNTKLQLNKKYQYKVRAYKVQGGVNKLSIFTDVKSITTSKLAVPTDFRVTNLGGQRVKCSWDKVNGAEGYQVQCESFSTKKNTKDLSCVLSGMSKGKTYKFRVRAYKTVKNETGKTYKAYSSWTSYKSIKVK